MKNVQSTGKWKEGSDGTKTRIGTDGKDGSIKVERLTPTKDGSHAHEVIKGSPEGEIKSVNTANKNKRG